MIGTFTYAPIPDPRKVGTMIVEEPDWTADRDWEVECEGEHPNLLGFMTEERWVCSDGDLEKAMSMIRSAQEARKAR